MRPAILVLDMVAELTTGRLGSPAARGIRSPLRTLLAQARRIGMPVIYCQKACAADEPGGRSDPLLKPRPAEPVLPKQAYDAFFGTDLDERLSALGVDTVILTGLYADIDVQHTAAGAFFRGYRVTVPKEGTSPFMPGEEERAFQAMATLYGAKITGMPVLIRRLLGKRSQNG